MANFWHLLPQKATICAFSMEDSFSNHSVFLSLRSGFEIKIREIYLRSFGFEIRNSSNFAQCKIRIQNSRKWRQKLRFVFEMWGDSVESANLKIFRVVEVAKVFKNYTKNVWKAKFISWNDLKYAVKPVNGNYRPIYCKLPNMLTFFYAMIAAVPSTSFWND